MSLKHGFCFHKNVVDYDQIFSPMERPFERKSSDNEARISRRRKETSSARDLIVEAYQDLGGVPHPIGVPPRERKSPTQSGEFKRAKNIHPGEEIEEIPPENLEEVPDEAAAEAALEMGDGDTVPTREIMPWASTLPNEKSRQQKRAEIRQGEKRVSKVEKKSKSVFDIEDKTTASAPVKKPRGFYPAGSLAAVMDRMDAIEIDLTQTRKEHNENLKGTEEKLLRELESLRKSLTAKNEGAIQTPAEVHDELPDLNLQYDGTLSVRGEDEPEMSWGEAVIDNPDAIATTTKTNRPKKKTEQPVSLEGQALLESIADKYGIILSPGARAERLRELNETLEGFAPQLAEEARLNRLLADDEETLRTTDDITASNEEGLKGRIKDTKKKLASISKEVGDARDERDTLVEYPTAAEEVEFNMAETINEIARTNPKNAIRLRQLHNTFADLERMKNLLRPEAETLAERYGIIIDPTQREARLTRLQKDVRKLQEEYNQVDDDIISHQERQKETNIFKVRDRLGDEIKKLEEKREQIRNLYDEAGDQYSDALVSSPEKEIEARVQELREDRNNGFNDTAVVDERIAGLERLKSLISPPLSEKETQPQDLGLDYAYEPKQEEEPAPAEVDLDEENPADVVDVVVPEEATFQWTPSRDKALRVEEAKFRAPREERNLPPRVLPGQTRESLVQRVRKIDEMLGTGAVDGKAMSSQRRQQLARGRDALARRLETASDISAREAEGENNNGRVSGIRETILPFPTSGSSDPKTLEEDRLIAEHEVAKTEQAQTRERNAQVYKARAQEYKKELHWIANALAERGEFVEVPGQTPLAAEPEKKPWYSSAWTKIREATFRRDIAKLKQHFEATLGYYEEAEQTARAAERGLRPLKKARAGMGGLAESSERLNERLNDQIHFEKTLDGYKHMREKARDVSNYLLTGKSPDGRTLTPGYKDNLRTAFVKEVIALQEGTTIAERKALEKIMGDIDEIYLPITKFTRSNVGALQTLELGQKAREDLENIGKTSLRRLQVLEARAYMGKTRDERKEAQEDLEALKRDIGGKTPDEINTKILHSLEAAVQLASLEIETTSKRKLVHSYSERLRSIEENLGLAGEAKAALKTIREALLQAK